jgi:hypothetical protein
MTPKKHTGDVLPYLNIYYIFSRYILARLRRRFIFHLKEDLEFYDLVRTDFLRPYENCDLPRFNFTFSGYVHFLP